MLRTVSVLSWWFGLLIAFASVGAQIPMSAEPIDYWACRSAGTVRTVSVDSVKESDFSCITTYSKNGVEQVVGRGTWMVSCQKIAENILQNLKSAQWKCSNYSGKVKVYDAQTDSISE